MKDASHFVTVNVHDLAGAAPVRSTKMAVCPRHLKVLKEHAVKRAAETGFRIDVEERVIEPPPAAEAEPARLTCAKCGQFLTGIRAEMRLTRCARCE